MDEEDLRQRSVTCDMIYSIKMERTGDRELLVLEEEDEQEGARSRPWLEDSSCLSLVHLSAVVAAIGGLLFGYDVGVISGAKVQVAADLGLSCRHEELLVGLMPLGALTASTVAHHLLSRIGRKASIQLTALVFTVSALLMAFSSSLLQLLVGRFTIGFAVSLSAMAECLYISEISSPNNRGLLVSLNELGITIGFLLAYIVNYIFMETEGGWRYMFGLSSVLSIVQLLLLLLLPRTPHFLVMKGRDAEAVSVLRRIRGSELGLRQEVADIRSSMTEASQASCSGLFGSEHNMRGRLVIALGLVILQQMTGQPNILYYATDVFEAVGFCGETLASLAAVGLGLVKVAATVVSLCLVDRVGRRTLLLAGVAMMATSLLCLTVFAGYQHHISGDMVEHEVCSHLDNTTTQHTSVFLRHNATHEGQPQCEDNPLPSGVRYLAFIAIVTFVAAYSLSFGPVTWILLSELFPLGFKGQAMSLGQAVNWTSNVFVSVTFLDAVRVLTLPSIFFFYFFMAIISLIFIYFCVPETRNKTLEEISRDLKKGVRIRDCSFGFHQTNREQQNTKQFIRLEDEIATDTM